MSQCSKIPNKILIWILKKNMLTQPMSQSEEKSYKNRAKLLVRMTYLMEI